MGGKLGDVLGVKDHQQIPYRTRTTAFVERLWIRSTLKLGFHIPALNHAQSQGLVRIGARKLYSEFLLNRFELNDNAETHAIQARANHAQQ